MFERYKQAVQASDLPDDEKATLLTQIAETEAALRRFVEALARADAAFFCEHGYCPWERSRK